jgi:hypothetical protein
MDANETAQHVRKIFWRFGDTLKEAELFVTTKVNY